MNLIGYVFSSDNLEVLFKLLLSALLCGSIGIQRSSFNKPAGFGTHAIIGISSALVVIGSQFMASNYDMDASRIPSQIIAGIGFIGAGTIIRNGFNVRGVTTAAAILSVTCIGITVGMGYYVPSIFATALVFIVLYLNHPLTDRIERFESVNLIITVENISKSLKLMEEYFKSNSIVMEAIKKENDVIKDKKTDIVKVVISYDNKKTRKSEIVGALVAIDSILEVSIEE